MQHHIEVTHQIGYGRYLESSSDGAGRATECGSYRMQTYRKVRSLERGLDILGVVNERRGATVSVIAEEVGLHRTTVYRMLETLEDLGFVRRRVADDTYWITARVQILGNGLEEDGALLDAATPPMRELITEIDWPASLVTPQSNMLIIRETTHGRSRIHVHNVGIGTRIPIETSAVGSAYLAFCDPKESSTLIDALINQQPASLRAKTARCLEEGIRTTRENGFAISSGGTWQWLTGIAMPVRCQNKLVACVNMVFLTSAFRSAETLGRHVPVLNRTVHQIEHGLQEKSE